MRLCSQINKSVVPQASLLPVYMSSECIDLVFLCYIFGFCRCAEVSVDAVRAQSDPVSAERQMQSQSRCCLCAGDVLSTCRRGGGVHLDVHRTDLVEVWPSVGPVPLLRPKLAPEVTTTTFKHFSRVRPTRPSSRT